MATFNGEKYLPAQLESILAQTVPPYELVICDDGSTDETVAIAERFAQRAPFRVRIDRNTERLGYAENFLKAARLCDGELICFSDQDDIWHREKLERSVLGLSDECRLLVHNVRVVDATLARVPRGRIPARISRRYVTAPGEFQPWLLIPGMTLTFRRRLLEIADDSSRPSAVDHSLGRMCHDEWIYFLATATGKVAFVTDHLVLYRQHGRNAVGRIKLERGWLGTRAWTPKFADLHRVLIRQSRLARDYAAFLAELSFSGELCVSERIAVEAACRLYLRNEAWQSHRASIYDSTMGRSDRLTTVMRLMRSRAYRARRRGGLGAKSLLKDLAASIVSHSPTGAP